MIQSDVIAEEIAAWHSEPAARVLQQLATDPRLGLGESEVQERLEYHGRNELAEDEKEPWWQEVLESLTEPLQLLLVGVAVVYFWLGERQDAFTILGVILIVVAIEVTSELRAKRAVAALATLSAPTATVVRGAATRDVPARDLVPGDVVLLSAGSRVPADLRLVESSGLHIDESSLTGESVPVAKQAGATVSPQTSLAERVTMAYASTLVTSGKARGLVVATGEYTELGRIAGLVRQAREPRTPLQQALNQLAQWLVWVAIGFSVLVPLLGVVLAGRPVREMVLVGLTLAFATIPEELPILITLVLGLGALGLARRNAIVRRLRAAETLGSVSVVVTDKTGTLTQNRMRVVAVLAQGGALEASRVREVPAAEHVIVGAVLANDARQAPESETEFVGDPTETALLAAAVTAGMPPAQIRQSWRILEEYPFSDARKRMSVLAQNGSGAAVVFTKGSPESVLSVCTQIRNGEVRALDDRQREELLAEAQAQAARGRRMLGVAEKALRTLPDAMPGSPDAVETEMVFCGMLALEDPPRPEARAAVEALQDGGVRVIMVTGDHPATAKAIAQQVGIAHADQVRRAHEIEELAPKAFAEALKRTAVFARATPEHKLRIVEGLQRSGEIVAVTGDGVNDAAALKQAAIGVAMGCAGTDAAREAASLVLADDNFATVTQAVHTGRVLYANLRKAVRYYLAAKVALVLSCLAAVVLKLPVPFEPVHIILMELFMDLGASVTFVAEGPENDVMAQPPRDPKWPFMDRAMQVGIWFGGAALGGAVLAGYLGALTMQASIAQAQTAAFIAWMIGHVVLAANMRSERQPLLSRALWSNKPFLLWAVCAGALVLGGLALPAVQARLHLESPPSELIWLAAGAAILLPMLWEPWKWLADVRRRATE